MTVLEIFDAGVARRVGHYADAVRIPAGYDQIIVSGTPGLGPDGALAPDFAEEATQAWRNVETILGRAGAGLLDIVSVRQWLTSAHDVAAYVAVRSQFITHQPTFMLGIVSGLVWPNIRVEIEVVAAVPATPR